MPISQHIFINGVVQGVSYRYYLREAALAVGVTGWCRNLPDGRVEALIQGSQQSLDTVLQWCHQGPPAAQVTAVEVKRVEDTTVYQGFEIRR